MVHQGPLPCNSTVMMPTAASIASCRIDTTASVNFSVFDTCMHPYGASLVAAKYKQTHPAIVQLPFKQPGETSFFWATLAPCWWTPPGLPQVERIKAAVTPANSKHSMQGGLATKVFHESITRAWARHSSNNKTTTKTEAYGRLPSRWSGGLKLEKGHLQTGQGSPSPSPWY